MNKPIRQFTSEKEIIRHLPDIKISRRKNPQLHMPEVRFTLKGKTLEGNIRPFLLAALYLGFLKSGTIGDDIVKVPIDRIRKMERFILDYKAEGREGHRGVLDAAHKLLTEVQHDNTDNDDNIDALPGHSHKGSETSLRFTLKGEERKKFEVRLRMTILWLL